MAIFNITNPFIMKKILLPVFLLASLSAFAQNTPLKKTVSARADALQSKIIAWRRDFHEHPELGNREVRTSGIIAKHLQALGIEVQTGVATTGVVGLLKGGPGPGCGPACRYGCPAGYRTGKPALRIKSKSTPITGRKLA
jgi:hypothetical protein